VHKEPALTVGAITGTISAVVALLVAFGLPVTQEQQNALIALAGALFVLIPGVSAIIRGLVYSPNTVDNIVEETVDAVADEQAPTQYVIQ
jgi:hypothetical protein